MIGLIIFLLLGFLASRALVKRILAKHRPAGDFIQVDYAGRKVRLHYLDSLANDSDEEQLKPTLILIHGATGNIHDFKASIYDELAEKYRVIAFDRPGLGFSERPRYGESREWCSPREQMKLIRNAVLAMGIQKPFILGHSLAGPIVLDYMMDFGDELAGAVLLSPVSHPWPNGVTWYNYLDMFPVLRELLAYTWLPVIGYFNVDSGLKTLFHPEAVPKDYREKTVLDLFFRPRVMLDNFRDQHLLCEYVALAGRGYRRISTPVQIITGTNDDVVSSWLHSEKLSHELQQVQWLDIPDLGHSPHHSRTDIVVRQINEFIEPIQASVNSKNER